MAQKKKILHCFKRRHCEKTLSRTNSLFTFSAVVVLPSDCILSSLFPAETDVLVPVLSRSTDVVVVNFVVVLKFPIDIPNENVVTRMTHDSTKFFSSGYIMCVAKRLDARYDWLPSPTTLSKYGHLQVVYVGDACSSNRFYSDVTGHLVLVASGGCSYFTKVLVWKMY